MQKHQLSNGFTLVEMLLVIAIIAVIAGMFSYTLYKDVQKARLNEAAALVQAEIKRARTAAHTRSVNQTVTWSADSVTAGGRFVPLPYGVRIINEPKTFFTYLAPWAEFQANDPATNPGRLELVDRSGRWHTAVDLQGVTGRPVRRAVLAVSQPLP